MSLFFLVQVIVSLLFYAFINRRDAMDAIVESGNKHRRHSAAVEVVDQVGLAYILRNLKQFFQFLLHTFEKAVVCYGHIKIHVCLVMFAIR